MEFINKYEFVTVVLDKNLETFIKYISILKVSKITSYFF